MATSAIDRMKERARARAIASRNGVEPGGPSLRVKAALDSTFGDRALSLPGYEGDTRGSVEMSTEFRRVHDLPRVGARNDLQDLVELLTEAYRTPEGEMTLRPIQALTLEAVHDHRGAFGAIGVGEGKTLITYLAPLVMGAESPVLIVPAKLKRKTERDFADLRKHWREGASIRIVSYEKLGRVSGADELAGADLVMADEVQKLKNLSAAVTRRVVRFLRENPEVVFLALSGTIASRSLMDFHHLLALTLGADAMPLPAPSRETKVWARAVDEKVTTRARPGPLRMLLETGEVASLENVRAAVGRRIFSAPGVLSTPKKSVDASIIMDFWSPKLPASIKPLMDALTVGKIAPNGDEATPADVYRHARTLVCGFFYEWDPPPPEDWMDARRQWKRFARDILEQEDPRFDSEFQVALGVKRGLLNSGGVWEDWAAIKDTFKPNSVPRWVDTSTLRGVASCLTGPTIIWVEHVAVGEKLSEITGLPYFQRLGQTSTGAFIQDADPSGSIIASIASNAEGRNLQAWSRNVVVTPPASGKTWEQMLGRTHRQGQEADEIEVTVILGHGTIRQSMRQALADAKFIQATTGQPQRLLMADLTLDL